jgi:glycerate-2-kinase
MLITNFKNLARNSLRRKALLIAEAGYQAIDIRKTISERMKIKNNFLEIRQSQSGLINKTKLLRLNLDDFKRISLIGIGKGSALTCASLAKILSKKLSAGIALDVSKVKTQNSKVKSFVGTHPLPSKQNVKATQKIVKLAKNLKKDDLLINFICGGGSALACSSQKELKDLILVTKLLTKSGANILELNTIRKHLSEIKGGGLAKIAYPATVVSLIASDVIGNDLSMVASGPTAFDKTTKKDAEKVLKKYNLSPKRFSLKETPNERKYFKKVKNILFVCNQDAVLAMNKKAKKLGFKPKIYSLAVKGEARRALLPMIEKVKFGEALLAAGETTVNLDNRPVGKGGRNMEAVLGALTQLKTKNLVLLSFASDGRDNTEAAGAIGDFFTLEKAKKLKLEPEKFLDQNNSFNFFKKTGDLIFAKSKSFNVSDLMIILKQ